MTATRPTTDAVADAMRGAVPTLDLGEQRLALELYRALMEGRPISASELAARTATDPAEVEEALARWPGVFRGKDGRIIGFWGLAVRGMPHRLSSRSGRLTTWCALDPLLIAPLVTDEARVESSDPVSGEPISLTVTPDGPRDVSPPTAVLSMLLPDRPFSHDVVQSFCHFVHFFTSEETGRKWTGKHPGTFLLGVEEAFEVARRSWPALFEAASRELANER